MGCDAGISRLVVLLLLFHLLLLLLGKALEMQKGYLVCLDSANIKDLLKLETGKREMGNQFWASLVMEVRNKDARPQKGTTAMRECIWVCE